MTYTEKELDQFLHGISLSLLSKKSAQHWRYDEETAKEIEWLEVLERKVRADKADRKTEPQMGDAKPIPLSSRITQTEPQTMYYPQVDGIRPILTVKAEPNCSEKPNNCEPQTERSSEE